MPDNSQLGNPPRFFHPWEEATNAFAAREARRLVEQYLDEKIRVLRLIATKRIEWVSPFFWTVLTATGGYHTLAMRYNDAADEWFIEAGTDQEWSFESEE